MNAKVLATIMFAFLPIWRLRNPATRRRKRKWSRARFACGQERQWVGREWRSDAGRGRIRRKRDHRTIVKAPFSDEVNKMMSVDEHFRAHRLIDPELK